MTRIIDLGNGYARLDGYGSKYASLIFFKTLYRVRQLYTEGYLDRNELQEVLLNMGYTDKEVAFLVALSSVTVEQWKARVHGYRTI